ncbi:hypothetical protein niasHT_002689 [Heterodera trifolii]|uniref:Uncharacterized protein n=1 Tax=Heterodera trifolii TaxID=157864 RepID=A0ABD2MDY8_9BILA
MGAPRIVQNGGSALYKKRYQSDDHRSGATKPKRFRPVEDQPSHSGWTPATRTIRPVEDQPSHSGWIPAIRTIRPPFPAKAVYDFWKLEIIPPIPPFVNDRAPFCRRVQIEKGGEVLGFFNQQFYFSNFNEAYEFVIHGRTYRCVEQYYCAQKTLYLKRFDAADAIMLGTNKYGKRISPFEMKKIAHMNGEEEVTVREWTELKVGIMEEALKDKFSVPDLKDVLLSTGSAIICELSPDQFWGVGCRPGLIYDKWPTANIKQWNGSNTLGRLLMQLRDDLKEATPKGTTQAVQPNYGRSKNGEENFQNIPVEEDVFDLKSFENLEITITDEAEKGYKPKKSTNANSISELLMSHADEVAETEETTNEKFALSERINQWLKYAGINCQVLVFGSSLCQLARHGSDLDLFIYKFDQTSIRLGDELGKVRKILRQKYPRTEMELRVRGNTPVLKIKLEFHVDLTIGRSEKLNGVYNSVWLASLVRINDLFRSVCLLIKEWGTDINRPEFGSFNSLSLVIMVQSFFAEQKLLPSLFRLYPDIYKEDKIVKFYDAEFHQELAEDAKAKCPQSTPSVIEVLTDFFLWLDDIDFARVKLSAKSGKIDRTEGNGLQPVIIEEPFDARSNCSRSLTDKEFQNFKGLLRRTNTSLRAKDWYTVKRLFRLKPINDVAWSMTDESEDDSFDKIAVEQINESMKKFAGIKSDSVQTTHNEHRSQTEDRDFEKNFGFPQGQSKVSQQGFAIEEREFVKFNRQLDRTRRDVNFGEPLDGEVRTSQLDAQLTALLGTDLTHLNPNFLIRQLSDNQQIEAEWISQNILEIWPCSPVYDEATIRRCNRHLCPLTLRSANLHFSLHIHRVISAPPLLGHPPSHQPPLSLHCPSFAPSSLGPTA